MALQFAVWFGFYAAYQAARGAADRGVAEAFWNGTLVIEAENKLQALIEPGIQNFVERSDLLIVATSYTYWLSQFAVVGLALLWVYFRHHERFADFRNWLIGANLVGLIGYVLMPTAPPRMYPEWGFSDTLAEFGTVSHDSGLVAFAANPYAAMPSLHAMDALIVGIVMASVCRSRWARVPVARVARLGVVRGDGHRKPLLARLRRGLCASRSSSRRSSSADGCAAFSQAPRERATDGARGSVSSIGSSRSTHEAAREILRRSMRGVAQTKLTPDMLTVTGSPSASPARCSSASSSATSISSSGSEGVLFVVGSIADILDGALARAASKGTVFGAFLDSTFDRVGEAAILATIGLSFMHDGNEVALVAAFAAVIGSFLVSYTRAKAEALGLRGDVGFGSRVERVVLDLRRPVLRAVGLAAVADLRARRARVAHRRPADPVRAPPAARAGRSASLSSDRGARTRAAPSTASADARAAAASRSAPVASSAVARSSSRQAIRYVQPSSRSRASAARTRSTASAGRPPASAANASAAAMSISSRGLVARSP